MTAVHTSTTFLTRYCTLSIYINPQMIINTRNMCVIRFEPSSSEINLAANQRQFRDEILKGFWETAIGNVMQAKEIARCRGEELLIYFASDDVRLRTCLLFLPLESANNRIPLIIPLSLLPSTNTLIHKRFRL